MFNIEEELKKLPAAAGVYIMKDKSGNILYVGKAVSLKSRVKQYFRAGNKSGRIEKMVSLIDHFEYIVTDNESEALILECNLIKKNMPKFNVLLKDDKTYPYIKIDIKSEFPNVCKTRSLKNDGARYFGPYPNEGAASEMIGFIRQKFQIRQCKKFKSNKRACLNYHIKKCPAPCMGYISKEEYRKTIEQIIMLLEGKITKVIKQIEEDILVLSEKQDYEQAAMLRDKKMAIIQISEKQKMANINENTIDVIALSKNPLSVCIEIFFVRNSRMVGREQYFFSDLVSSENSEILSEFVKQYYLDKLEIPARIIIQEKFSDMELVSEMLSKKANRKVEFRTPKKGEKLRFIEMAQNNASIALVNRTREKEDILNNLKEALSLSNLPRKIECFDISNISGKFIVGAMAVCEDGVIKKNLARRFKIKTVISQDDPKSLEEVVRRRLKHSISDQISAFGKLPDVIFADGGITQIRGIKKALKEYNLNIPVFGMVKDESHKSKMLIDENRREKTLDDTAMKFVANLQDEVHRLAIEYNKKLREKDMTKSKLDQISGIGESKRNELLKKFGSIEGIKKAKISEISEISGINEKLASKIKKELD